MVPKVLFPKHLDKPPMTPVVFCQMLVWEVMYITADFNQNYIQ